MMKRTIVITFLITACLSTQAQLQNPYGTIIEDSKQQKYDIEKAIKRKNSFQNLLIGIHNTDETHGGKND